MESNSSKLCLGVVEVLWFGACCFEPLIWPEFTPDNGGDDCEMPFTLLTAVYASFILVVMVPIRIWFSRRKEEDPERNNLIFAVITLFHMAFCLGWLLWACADLSESSDACWHPVTVQYVNYYVLLLMTLGPACTLGFATIMFILCLPCLVNNCIELIRDEHKRKDLSEKVVSGLSQRSFNPEVFTA